jgi:hypothetical protein
MYGRCGSSYGVPALQARNPEYKPQVQQQQKKLLLVSRIECSEIDSCIYGQLTFFLFCGTEV